MRAAAWLLGLVLAACSAGRARPPSPAVPPGAGPSQAAEPPPPFAPAIRTPAVAPDHPLYAGYEGPEYENGCLDDGACVRSGPNRSVCTAEDRGASEAPAQPPPEPAWSCGCVAGLCVWYTVRDR